MPGSKSWWEGDDDEGDEAEDFFPGGESGHELDDNWLLQSPIATYVNHQNPLDPLGLLARCTKRLRERALMLDLQALIRGSLARVASDCMGYEPAQPFDVWLGERIDETMESLLRADMDAEREGLSEPDGEGRFMDIEMILGIDRQYTRLALVTLNGLDDETRHVFYEVNMLQRTPRDMQKEGFPLERTEELVERALLSVKSAIEQVRQRASQEFDRMWRPSFEADSEESNPDA